MKNEITHVSSCGSWVKITDRRAALIANGVSPEHAEIQINAMIAGDAAERRGECYHAAFDAAHSAGFAALKK